MTWIVRKYVAYLVFNSKEGEHSETHAFEPFSNKVLPAVFEGHYNSASPYRDALKKARELNAANKPIQPTPKAGG